jgi:HEAT repeat protein
MPKHDTLETQILTNALQGDRQCSEKVISYLSSNNPSLRGLIYASIHACPDRQIWLRLIGCLSHNRWSNQVECNRLRDETSRQRFEQSIIELFSEDKTDEERIAKESALTDCLQSEELETKTSAAYLSGIRGSKAVIPILEMMIDSKNPAWQLQAIKALAAINSEVCGPPLVKALAVGNQQIHQQARRALSDLGQKATTGWVQALNHPDSHIRWHAARALSEIGDTSMIHILVEGLSDEEVTVRWATARALANLEWNAVPAILEFLTHTNINDPLREAAHHALNSMTDHSIRRRLDPLIQALEGSAAAIEAPLIAQRLLQDLEMKKQSEF